MLIPIPIPIFIRNIFEEPKEDLEVKRHLEMVNIMSEMINESKQRYEKLFSQLTEDEKKKLEKMRMPMFTAGYYDFLDSKSNNIKVLLNKRRER